MPSFKHWRQEHGGGSCCSEVPAASHCVDGSDALTRDEGFPTVQRKIAKTIKLPESIGKGQFGEADGGEEKLLRRYSLLQKNTCGSERQTFIRL
ncbi:hypothetical protein STEG23_016700 [Scotinomys teguina]